MQVRISCVQGDAVSHQAAAERQFYVDSTEMRLTDKSDAIQLARKKK